MLRTKALHRKLLQASKTTTLPQLRRKCILSKSATFRRDITTAGTRRSPTQQVRNPHRLAYEMQQSEIPMEKPTGKDYAIIAAYILGGGFAILQIVKFIDDNSKDIIQEQIPALPTTESESEFSKWLKHTQQEMLRNPLIYTLLGVNVLAFILIRTPIVPVQLFRLKHMVLSVRNVYDYKRFHTLVTCMFAHVDIWHIALNMYALYHFGPDLLQYLGPAPFLALYLGSGIFASLLSLASKRIMCKTIGSIGASGAIFGLLGAYIARKPDDARLGLIFLPSSFSLEAKYFLPLYFVVEILLNIFSKNFQLDTAGHLGGAIMGFLIVKYLMQSKKHTEPRKITANFSDHYYVGELQHMRRNGHGIMISQDKTSAYQGQWKNDKFDGKGLLVVHRPTSSVSYNGYFKEGKRHGVGETTHIQNGMLSREQARYENNTPVNKV